MTAVEIVPCTYPDKLLYLSRRDAHAAIRRLKGRGRQHLSPYRCGAHWHAGRSTAEQRAALRTGGTW
jgi:hypothetical protein